jgi:hypothetical protein
MSSAYLASLKFLSTPYQDAVLSNLVPELLAERDLISELAPFRVSDSESAFLAELGIPSDPTRSGTRPHKLHVAICNAANLIAARTFNAPTAIVSSKSRMYEHFSKHSKTLPDGFKCPRWHYNLMLDGSDPYRYASGGQQLPKLEDECRHVHFDHSGHFLSQADLDAFFSSNPKLESVTFIACLPAEALFGWSSTFSNLYELSYNERAGTFTYHLETGAGTQCDSYEQPLSTLSWFTTGAIAGRNLLRVDFLQQWASFHLVSVRRASPDQFQVGNNSRFVGAGRNFLLPEIYFHQAKVR